MVDQVTDQASNVSAMTLTDQLAIDRTNLGNMRTLLAAIRTSLALLGVGVSLLKFFSHNLLHAIARLSIVFSVVVLIAGIAKYVTYKRYLRRLVKKRSHFM